MSSESGNEPPYEVEPEPPTAGARKWLEQWYQEKRQADIQSFVRQAVRLGMSRRQALKIGGIAFGFGASAAIGNYYGVEKARAAATGEFGTAASPVDKGYVANLHGGGVAINVEDDLDASGQAITADDFDIADPGSGTLDIYSNNTVGNGDVFLGRSNITVGTSATSIAQVFSVTKLTVYGEEVGSSSTRFIDEVLAALGGSSQTTVIASETNNTPNSRTYTISGNDVKLAMGSTDYEVTTEWRDGRGGA